MNYRRAFIPGGSFFFTLVTEQRQPLLASAEVVDVLRMAFRVVPNRARVAKGQQAIWQHRYWEHALRDQTDFARHADYIHFNPVKHGYVSSAMEWPYSSFRRYVKSGVYPVGWGQGLVDFEGVGHE